MLRDLIQRSWWGKVLGEHDTEPAELSGGVLKIALGVWFLLPWDSVASSPTFVALRVLPEWAWGVALIAFGLFHLIAVRDGHRAWRRAACLVGFLVWFALACAFVWANPPAVGWLMFLMAALGQGWAYIRLGSSA